MIYACFKKRADATGLAYAFQRLIQIVTGRYIHQEIMFSDGMCFSSRDEGPGWARVKMDPYTWDLIRIPATAEQEALMRHQADNIINGAFTGVRPKYGWLKDIMGFLPIPVMIQDPKQWFCSEACCVVIQVTGMLLGYATQGISPTRAAKYLTRELPLWERAQITPP